jgi:hypothetical protein
VTPYKRNGVLNRIKMIHNTCLSADRVSVENIFALIKGRFRRLIFINTYSISKAIEIATTACVLHNFCYFNGNEWEHPFNDNELIPDEYLEENTAEETRRAKQKRNLIVEELFRSHDN